MGAFAPVPIIAGDNQFTAHFDHDNLKSDDATQLIIPRDKSLERKGTLYILTVGIDTIKMRITTSGLLVPTLMRLAKHSKRSKISSLNMHTPQSSR